MNEAIARPLRVETDEYVPIWVKSHDRPFGAKYVRCSGSNSSLLELLLDDSMTIRGLTLTVFDRVHEPSAFRELPARSGLPVVRLSDEQRFEGPIGAQRIDIFERLSVGFGPDFVEIDLDQLSRATDVISSGPVAFYVNEEALAGIRVGGLTKRQLAMIGGRDLTCDCARKATISTAPCTNCASDIIRFFFKLGSL